MAEQLANLAEGTLSVTIDADDVAVVLGAGEGALFPATGNFRVTIEDEIMLCTSRATDTLTVTRAQESTAGATHAAGKAVVHTLTKAGLDQYLKELDTHQIQDGITLAGADTRVAWTWGAARNVLLYIGNDGGLGGLGAPDGGIGVRVFIQCATNLAKILHSTAGTYQEFYMPNSDDLWLYYYDFVEFVYDGVWWSYVSQSHPRLDDVSGDVSVDDTDMLWGGRNAAHLLVNVNYTGVGGKTLRSLQMPPDGGSMNGTQVTLYNTTANSFIIKHNSAGIPVGYQEFNMIGNANRTILNQQGITFRYQNAGWREMPGSSALYEHIADTTDAHDASAISVLDADGDFTATDVENVLAELNAKTPQYFYGLAVDAANTDLAYPTGVKSSFLTYEIAGGTGTLRSFGAPNADQDRLRLQYYGNSITLEHGLSGGTGKRLFNNSGADRTLKDGDYVEYAYSSPTGWFELEFQNLHEHLDDTSQAHAASAISILDSANDYAATNVEDALAEIQTSMETPATIWVPIDLRNAQTAANAGNSFPTVVALTDWEFWHWEFVKDVIGKVYGVVHVPKNIHATPAAKVVLMVAANATSGVTRLQVSSKNVADAGSLNPTLTDETAQDITVPGTAYLRKDVSFTLTNAPAAGDILLVEVHHEGNHANDSLAVNTLLLGAYLEISTKTTVEG